MIAALTQPVLIAIALAALVSLYLGFKLATLAARILLLLLIALALLAGVGCFFLANHAN